MTLTLPQKKVNTIIEKCQLFLTRDQVTVQEIVQLIEKSSYSAVAILPTPLHFRSLQRQHILGFSIQKKLERKGGQERIHLVG